MFNWSSEFRRDYAELKQLRILTGIETSWALFSATFPTEVFNFCYNSVGMGLYRPFWGIDLGSDRTNLALWVRPMEYAKSSYASLFAFIPDSPGDIGPLPKTIFYFSTRREAREACSIIRNLLPKHLAASTAVFTAVYSDSYKEEKMAAFRSGEIRWLFCTDAAGMGCDVPDILQVVVYGAQDLCSAFQKGGRAARDPSLQGTMVWLVEGWAFDVVEPGSTAEGPTDESSKRSDTAKGKEAERRDKLDPAARIFINRTQSQECMRQFANEYFTPRPSFVGQRQDDSGWPVTWEVTPRSKQPSPGACCSAQCCRLDPGTPIGELTSAERVHISRLEARLNTRPRPAASDLLHPGMTASPSRRCPQQERELLNDILYDWRDRYWQDIRADNPFLSAHWVVDNETLDTLVSKAHRIVNQPVVDEGVVRNLVTWLWDDNVILSLVGTLESFRVAFNNRGDERQKKQRTSNAGRDSSPTATHRPRVARPLAGIPDTMQHA